MLDTPELLHLAIHASQKGDTHAAMNYLKEALGQEPDNALARYLLAAEHAEIGLYDRAIEGMEAALQVAPGLEIAAFQLGLLYLQTNQPATARERFAALADSAQDPALRAFASAYVQLIAEQKDAAIAGLREGLACCDNEHLKGDMERVLMRLLGDAPQATPAAAAEAAAPAVASALALGAYRDSLDSN